MLCQTIFEYCVFMTVLRYHCTKLNPWKCKCRAPGSKVSGRGAAYLSNYRIVCVLDKPVDNVQAFDMPLVCQYSSSLAVYFFSCHLFYLNVCNDFQ